MDLPFDANKRQLNAKFYRKFVGQSQNDYTFKLDTEYDFIGAILVAASVESDESNKPLNIFGGSEGGYNTLKVIKFDQAFNSHAWGLSGKQAAWGSIMVGALGLWGFSV